MIFETEIYSIFNIFTGDILRLQGLFVAKQKPSSAPRKPRADARQNRDRILEIAKKVFKKSGADASLDDIAKQAGVGPGTLYRHFPSREDLLSAVYRDTTEKLALAAQEFARTLPPVEALRAWMMLFVDHIVEKKIIVPALTILVGDPKKILEPTHAGIWAAVRLLVKRGIDSGDIREDLDAVDFLRALLGVASIGDTPDWEKSARRLVDVLILGSRPAK
ncbi:MAG: TetR/AcrR family transcriptional regulator [Alphaproteobacteria bacterium]|nr:TetR/AcrR family transcriptional regulator [Alphaproteobacteria bacterium]